MTHWIATTKSGTTYTYKYGRVRINSERTGESYFTVWTFKTFEFNEISDLNIREALAYFNDALPNADMPEVGKHIYVAGIDEWRISTRVVEVKILEDEE